MSLRVLFRSSLTIQFTLHSEFYYSSPSFLTVAAVFRAATTFGFPKFADFARQFLAEEFPQNLHTVSTTPVHHSVAAAVLGRKYHFPQILKRAFYEIARSPPPDDDTPATISLNDLDPEDLILLANAQKHLSAAWLAVLSLSTLVCTSRPKCPSGTNNPVWAAVSADDGLLLHKYQNDPICGLSELIAVEWDSVHKFCDKCTAAKRKALLSHKWQIWMDMDEWFNIGHDDDKSFGE